MKSKGGQDHGALFFDSIPAKRFKFVAYPKSNKGITLRIASITKCIFAGNIVLFFTDFGTFCKGDK